MAKDPGHTGRTEKGCAEIYLHIPFCVRKCGYCDFLSFPSDDAARERYVRALIREIRATGEALSGMRIATVFMGGGTPTVLSSSQLSRIFDAVRESFRVSADAEISVEANPGTVDIETLRSLRGCGVNRLSIGCQSLDDRLLRKLGRIHTRKEFLDCYAEARRAGFDNINIDLMSAIPDQTYADWERTLRETAGLGPEHISAYSLILEEGTDFYVRRDSLLLPDEDTERRMYDRTREILSEYGYRQYEISNYAREGYRCRHNVGYWTGVPYAGLGLGASSLMDDVRFKNTDQMDEYLRFMESGKAEAPDRRSWRSWEVHRGTEPLSESDRMAEFMILGLRMTDGVSRAEFSRRFGRDLTGMYGDVIVRHVSEGLLADQDGRVFLTEAGLSLANYVMCDFLPD